MSRITQTFEKLKLENRKAFMPFITAGDPDFDTTLDIILGMEEAGASLVEIGVPFSDSIADGTTIQAANTRAIAGGATVVGVLEMVRRLREKSQIPVLLMGSFNPVVVYGVEKFCADAAAAGADGLIIADLLPDSADELVEPAHANGLDVIFLVAPTSTDERLSAVADMAGGFVYAVSVTGVTGVRESLPAELTGFIDRVRSYTDLPVCVGFGIGNAKTAQQAVSHAEGVIVGSAIIKRIAAAVENGQNPKTVVCQFVKEMVEAIA